MSTQINRPPHPLYLDKEAAALSTDLYQLTMLAAYWSAGRFEEASFELFVRRLPESRSFLIAAGLEQALAYLSELRFSRATVDWLREQPSFAHLPAAFFAWLEELRFRGDVWAVPEGTAVFANEPILAVTASLPEAQLVETYLLSTVGYQSSVASKAARMKLAAGTKSLVDFGTRRGHAPQAGLHAARAAYIAGFDGTSNVAAAKALGIPMVGTAAHSYVMSFADEERAFAHYLSVFPDSTTLLVDTYDAIEGARAAARLGPSVRAIRIDSGDLALLSRRCREILDSAGCRATRIVASGDLEEQAIAKLVSERAPIDVFGVGTELVTARDAGGLGAVYKLVEQLRDGRKVGAMKLSLNKVTMPGRKQIYRRLGGDGRMAEDEVELITAEPRSGGAPLLVEVMQGGAPTRVEPLDVIRERCASQLAMLPDGLRAHGDFVEYPVVFGDGVLALAEIVESELGAQQLARAERGDAAR